MAWWEGESPPALPSKCGTCGGQLGGVSAKMQKRAIEGDRMNMPVLLSAGHHSLR